MKLVTHLALPILVWSLILMSLTACAHRQARIITKEVRVPLSVPCRVDVPTGREYAAAQVPLDASIFTLVQALLVEREQRRARELELGAAIEACR